MGRNVGRGGRLAYGERDRGRMAFRKRDRGRAGVWGGGRVSGSGRWRGRRGKMVGGEGGGRGRGERIGGNGMGGIGCISGDGGKEVDGAEWVSKSSHFEAERCKNELHWVGLDCGGGGLISAFGGFEGMV